MKNNTFGKNLRKLRLLERLNLNALGKELEVTGSAVSAWELGKKEPNFDMLKKIAEYFMVSTDCLLNHQVLENEEQKNEVVTQLAHKLYEKSKDIPVFEEELLSYVSYLDFKNKSKHAELQKGGDDENAKD
ncbi:transcriptional regulator [Bacillus pseudomycoides]|uniref:helix-turn-helix domain-containing protein n=1 Tax=Bacillus pseudomycoides TaxID=64104 RepID=UPI000BEB71D5|nr:helix-turn-helix transcriptional regulator [Bacillus pseudomycoides]PEY35741.1 transcriptional regulator [Bacillus cereus]PEF72602.1 transcriptional regulator [Bacillus pseudomycoides]PEJ16701.1 transcriptional regulator [Bacillus pseudomycoides]PEK29228.1 transcriptional regulator [Bacillus pseudomycoides]PEK62175.1 transcriptional regulator [Bacillus pseudomycoides]